MYKVKIGNRLVGDTEPCFIIAEAGVNHNGNVQLAKEMIRKAKRLGADAIKFQTFKAERLTTASTGITEYQQRNIGTRKGQLEMLREIELAYPVFIELSNYCRKEGITFLSTPHSFDAIEFLNPLVSAYKMGSGDLTNIPALESVAKKGKPVLISTGMGNIEEIRDAVEAVRGEDNHQIVLLQCVTDYPSNLTEQNLRTIRTLREEFGVLTGFSDHTIGTMAAVIAVSVGACVIEKHFTLDRGLPGPDHRASIEPSEFEKLVDLIRETETALGNGMKEPTESEKKIALVARKSLASLQFIPNGTTITRHMIDIKRPQTGLKPVMLERIIGKKAKCDIARDTILKEDMIAWND